MTQNKPPITPGEILLKEFLEPRGGTLVMQLELLTYQTGVPADELRGIVQEGRRVTDRTAQYLALALKTTPEFWMNLQNDVDLWLATGGKL